MVWNALFGLAAFSGLYALFGRTIGITACLVASYPAAVTHAYFTYRRAVLHGRRPHAVREYLHMYKAYAVAFVLNIALLPIAVDAMYGLGVARPYIAQALVAAVVTSASLAGRRGLTFVSPQEVFTSPKMAMSRDVSGDARFDSGSRQTDGEETPGRTRPSLLAVAVFLGAAGLALGRSLYGVGLYDESYYAALAYRFALGDIPFVDEMHVLQTQAFLTTPVVWAWMKLVGSTEGLILALRVLYVALASASAGVWYRVLRRTERPFVSALGAVLLVLVVPYNIGTLSYNTMAVHFIAIGLGLLALRCRARWVMALAGGSMALAAVAYPSTLIVALAALVVLLWRHDGAAHVRAYVLGAGIVFGVVLVVVLRRAGLDDVLAAWRYTTDLGVYMGGFDKLRVMYIDATCGFFARQWLWWLAVACLVLTARTMRQYIPHAAGAVAIASVLPLGSSQPHFGPPEAVTLFVAGALVLLVVLWRDLTASQRSLAMMVSLPVVLEGTVLAYTSTNGFAQVGVGLESGLGFAALVFIWALESHGPPRLSSQRAWMTVPVLVLVCVICGTRLYTAVQGDRPIKELTTRLEGGPYACLHTTPEQAALLGQMTEDIAEVRGGARTILVFDLCQAAYLVSGLRPYANSLWLSGADFAESLEEHATLRYFEERGELPDVVLVSLMTTYAPDPTLRRWLDAPDYDLVVERSQYVVYRRTTDVGR